MSDAEEFAPTTAEDVTDELVELVADAIDGFQGTDVRRVDWEEAYDRVDGATMADGRELVLPTELLSPAFVELKKRVRKARQ